MNRRSFLKYLSSIPLIGMPVKLLANMGANTAKPINPDKYGTTSITPLPEWVKVGDHVDLYDEWIPDDAVSLAEKRNTDWNQVIASNRVGKDNAIVSDMYKALMDNHVRKS